MSPKLSTADTKSTFSSNSHLSRAQPTQSIANRRASIKINLLTKLPMHSNFALTHVSYLSTKVPLQTPIASHGNKPFCRKYESWRIVVGNLFVGVQLGVFVARLIAFDQSSAAVVDC